MWPLEVLCLDNDDVAVAVAETPGKENKVKQPRELADQGEGVLRTRGNGGVRRRGPYCGTRARPEARLRTDILIRGERLDVGTQAVDVPLKDDDFWRWGVDFDCKSKG